MGARWQRFHRQGRHHFIRRGRLGDVVYVSLPQVGEEAKETTRASRSSPPRRLGRVLAHLGRDHLGEQNAQHHPRNDQLRPYGDGWMFELEISDPSELDETLDADAYARTGGE